MANPCLRPIDPGASEDYPERMAFRVERDALQAELDAREPFTVDDPELPRAAVAAVFCDSPEELELLLIRRADDERDPWSGQIAFPGGRRDPVDPDLRQTAIRETREELGFDLASGLYLGRLDDVQAVARARRIPLAIAPFVFWLNEKPPIQPNYEVAEALWAPVGPLVEGRADAERPYVHEGTTYRLPAYAVERHLVWGLTYQMLTALLNVLRSMP